MILRPDEALYSALEIYRRNSRWHERISRAIYRTATNSAVLLNASSRRQTEVSAFALNYRIHTLLPSLIYGLTVYSLFLYTHYFHWNDVWLELPRLHSIHCLHFYRYLYLFTPLYLLCFSKFDTSSSARTNVRNAKGYPVFFFLRPPDCFFEMWNKKILTAVSNRMQFKEYILHQKFYIEH